VVTATYLPTDLQRHYRSILDEAKVGEARVRDSDGTSILLIPEAQVHALRQVSAAAANLAAVETVAEAMASRCPGLTEYGEWSWLRVFDADDLREFIRDIREAIVVAAREGSSALLEEQLRAWHVTAQQATDPVFRDILRGGASEGNFVEVGGPGTRRRADRGRATEAEAE
jgi:hypothetical protein